MATVIQVPNGDLAQAADVGPLAGSLLTLPEYAALAQAPRRPAGTEVSVQAKPVGLLAGRADHMFVQFDDGQNPLIARGQPSHDGLGFFGGLLDHLNRVSARVDPAPESPDYQQGYRWLASKFLPGVTADEAAAAARVHAQGVNSGANAYGPDSNSNSYAADVAEPIFGWRPGDAKTWGAQTHLRDAPTPSVPGSVFTGPLDGDDLTPIVNIPPY